MLRAYRVMGLDGAQSTGLRGLRGKRVRNGDIVWLNPTEVEESAATLDTAALTAAERRLVARHGLEAADLLGTPDAALLALEGMGPARLASLRDAVTPGDARVVVPYLERADDPVEQVESIDNRPIASDDDDTTEGGDADATEQE